IACGTVDRPPDYFFPVDASYYCIQKKFPRLNSSVCSDRDLTAPFEEAKQRSLAVSCLCSRGVIQRLYGGNEERVIGPDLDRKRSLADCGENHRGRQNFRDYIRPSKS